MTSQQKKLARKYILYRSLTSMWFISAIWLFFYRIFITDQQVGILDGMAFIIGLLAEVPSGALADKFGRDKVVKLGQLLAGGGLLIQAAGSSFMVFFIGQAIMMIGVSFVSGADEALFFDKIKLNKKSTQWRKLVTRGSQAALAATLVTTIIGGYAYSIDTRLPWVLNGIALIGSVFILWPINDTRPKISKKKLLPEINDYLINIKAGFAQFRLRKLVFYIPFIITVQGLFYATDWGLLRLILLERFRFDPFWGSIVIASSSLITIVLLSFFHIYAHIMTEKKTLVTIGLVAVASLLVSLADIGVWGYIVILGLYASDHILQPYLSEILNNQAPEEQRATVLSVASFFRTLPYVMLAPIIGYLSTNGTLNYFFVTWSVLIVCSLLVYLYSKKITAYSPQ